MSVAFQAHRGAIRVSLDQPRRGLLRRLAEDLTTLLGPPVADPLQALLDAEKVERPKDPALLRLFPDAYDTAVEDGEAAQEFRRLTAADLRGGKLADAERLLGTVDDSSIDAETAQSWLRTLNDLRLVFGEYLGLRDDDQAQRLLDELVEHRSGGQVDPYRLQLAACYEELGYLLEALVLALDEVDPPRVRDSS